MAAVHPRPPLAQGPNHGHYVALVRSGRHWLLFDDDAVELIDERHVDSCFGAREETRASTETGRAPRSHRDHTAF